MVTILSLITILRTITILWTVTTLKMKIDQYTSTAIFTIILIQSKPQFQIPVWAELGPAQPQLVFIIIRWCKTLNMWCHGHNITSMHCTVHNRNCLFSSLGRRSHLLSNSGKSPMGSIRPLLLFACLTASLYERPWKCMMQSVPVVPALWAPIKQCTRTDSPLPRAVSMNPSMGPIKCGIFFSESPVYLRQNVMSKVK